MEEKRNGGFGIASMILGIFAILGILFIIPSLLCGILAIVFGIISLVLKNKVGMPITGIILGGLGILITVIVLCVSIFIYSKSGFTDNLYKLDNSFSNKTKDVISGNSWLETKGNSYLALENDGTFKYYKDVNDLTNNYYEGTYMVYNAKEAINYIANDLSKYALTKEEQEDLINRNKKYKIEDYYCLVLNNEKRIINGQNTASNTVITPYYGFSNDAGDNLFLVNMNTATTSNLVLSK